MEENKCVKVAFFIALALMPLCILFTCGGLFALIIVMFIVTGLAFNKGLQENWLTIPHFLTGLILLVGLSSADFSFLSFSQPYELFLFTCIAVVALSSLYCFLYSRSMKSFAIKLVAIALVCGFAGNSQDYFSMLFWLNFNAVLIVVFNLILAGLFIVDRINR